MRRMLAIAAALAAMGGAYADDETDALTLADTTPETKQTARDWRLYAEVGTGQAWLRSGGATDTLRRLTVDLQVDKTFAPGWRAVLGDRLDLGKIQGVGLPAPLHQVNTLKEAYVSWQAAPRELLDLGRINLRLGAASGYNPTDVFRAGALRAIDSIDPSSLRENRLGSVMLRGQHLWTGGSLTAVVSPKLSDHPNDSAYDPDFGATNGRTRWLLIGSHQFSPSFNPQVLISGGAGQAPQAGVNLSRLLGDATVGFVEWAGGHAPSLAAQAGLRADDSRFRSRVATGLTYSTQDKLSLTLEYDYSGAGMDRSEWRALQHALPPRYAAYRGYAVRQQDLATQQLGFIYANWQDAGLVHLDLTAMLRYDFIDTSHQAWLEARYHWEHVELALQGQFNVGDGLSDFGVQSQRRVWQALARYYF